MKKNKRIGPNARMRKKAKKESLLKRTFSLIKNKYLLLTIPGIIIAAGLFLGGRYLIDFLDEKGIFRIDDIEVRGVSPSRQETIINSCEEEFSGTLFGFRKKEVKKILKSHKWVKDVDVKRKFPSAVEVSVTKRVPVALVNLGDVYLADKSGFIWKLQSGVYWDLPLINGIKDTLVHDRRVIDETYKDMLMKTLRVLRMREEKEVPLVSQIEFVEEGKEAVVKIRSGVAFARINTNDMEKSIRRVGEILEYSSYSRPVVLMVDLTYNNMAFVKTKRRLYSS